MQPAFRNVQHITWVEVYEILVLDCGNKAIATQVQVVDRAASPSVFEQFIEIVFRPTIRRNQQRFFVASQMCDHSLIWIRLCPGPLLVTDSNILKPLSDKVLTYMKRRTQGLRRDPNKAVVVDYLKAFILQHDWQVVHIRVPKHGRVEAALTALRIVFTA